MKLGPLPAGTGEPTVDKRPVLVSIANTEMSLEAILPTYAKCPEGSTAMTLEFIPAVGTVPLRVRWPVWGSMA
jgi:hypothetical protein